MTYLDLIALLWLFQYCMTFLCLLLLMASFRIFYLKLCLNVIYWMNSSTVSLMRISMRSECIIDLPFNEIVFLTQSFV